MEMFSRNFIDTINDFVEDILIDFIVPEVLYSDTDSIEIVDLIFFTFTMDD